MVHETVHQALYVQGRGELRRQAQQRQPLFSAPTVMISERPAEAADRAVPGHWEGDLIIGKDGKSAIGTLVERATPPSCSCTCPVTTAPRASGPTVETLPSHLTRSLTWDQGSEMGAHGAFTVATGIPVCFCDRPAPGSAAPTKTPTACSGSTSPKAPTSPCTPVNTWTP